jgi:hypothetical protein
METNTETDRNRNTDTNTYRDRDRDTDKDPAEIYADGSDTVRKFIQRYINPKKFGYWGLIPSRSLFRGV